jgi:hypothetical protein
MPKGPLEVCNTLWIGGDLGPVSEACLASFVRNGHRVILHCYDVPNDVPEGVEVADAAIILPSSRIIRHKETGSYSLFSNLFRYELLRQKRGLWIDCDVYCVQPIPEAGDHIFGWQSLVTINGAILKLPADSPALAELIGIFDRPSFIPPWLLPEEHERLLARQSAGEAFDLGDLPWGIAGPRAITHVFSQMGLSRLARQRRVFYPISYEDGPVLLRRSDLNRFVSAMTLTVHLWNEALRKVLHLREPGSPIDKLLKEGLLFDERRRLAS